MNQVNIKIKTNTTMVCKNGCQAIVDSGSDIIVGSKKEVDSLNKALGGKYSSNLDVYLFDCLKISSLLSIVFSIRGKSFSLSPQAYTSNDEEDCFSLIHGSNDATWTLGSPFMGAFYTVYDSQSNRVGFAIAK